MDQPVVQSSASWVAKDIQCSHGEDVEGFGSKEGKECRVDSDTHGYSPRLGTRRSPMVGLCSLLVGLLGFQELELGFQVVGGQGLLSSTDASIDVVFATE